MGAHLGKFLLGFVGFIVLMWAIGQDSDTPSTSRNSGTALASASSSAQTPAKPSRSDTLSNLRVENVRWRRDGFDTIMMANFNISSLNNFPVKDVEVTCKHFAKSGTQIDSNTRTIYEQIGSYGTLKVRDFNMGFIHDQVKRTECSVTDFEPV